MLLSKCPNPKKTNDNFFHFLFKNFLKYINFRKCSGCVKIPRDVPVTLSFHLAMFGNVPTNLPNIFYSTMLNEQGIAKIISTQTF